MKVQFPEGSVIAGVAVAGLVYSIHGAMGPSVASRRVSPPGDPDLDSTERQATYLSAAAVAGIALIAHDPTIFVIGGAVVVAMAWLHRYSNHYDAAAGMVPEPAPRSYEPTEV